MINLLFNHFIVCLYYYDFIIMFIIIFILSFYSNGNDDTTLHILLEGFESIKLIALTDPP